MQSEEVEDRDCPQQNIRSPKITDHLKLLLSRESLQIQTVGRPLSHWTSSLTTKSSKFHFRNHFLSPSLPCLTFPPVPQCIGGRGGPLHSGGCPCNYSQNQHKTRIDQPYTIRVLILPSPSSYHTLHVNATVLVQRRRGDRLQLEELLESLLHRSIPDVAPH